MANFFTGKKPSVEVDPYGGWNPLQRQLGQTTFNYLNTNLGKEMPQYTGTYASPLSQGEWDVVSRNARMAALGEQGLTSALRGEFPEDYYQNAIYKPMLKQYQEDIVPGLQEQYAGPGRSYWGSARANAVARGARDLTDTLAAQRASLGWQAQQNIPNAIAAANALSAASAQIQQTPRLVQQYGLDKQYEEWVRTRPENQKFIDEALNFLNISTVTRTNVPGEQSMFSKLSGLAGTAVGSFWGPQGAMIGGQLGGQVGSLFDRSGTQTSGGGLDPMSLYFASQLPSRWGKTAGGGANPNVRSLYDKLYPETGSGNANRLFALNYGG